MSDEIGVSAWPVGDFTPPLAPAPLVAPQPLPQQIAAYLRDMIIHDVLKPGERIRERQLSERLKVSRTPLRDALKILAMERLVDLLPNRGAIVVKHSAAEVRDMVTVYAALERLAGKLACANGTDAEFERIRRHDEEMKRAYAAKDIIGYFRANQRFHTEIAACSHNGSLIETHGNLNLRLYRFRYLAVTGREDWTMAVSEHEAILDALFARDGERLGRLLDEHLSAARRIISLAADATAEPDA